SPITGKAEAAALSAQLVVIPKIRKPLSTETSLEVPWRLVLSPHGISAWAHTAAPATHDGRTELWHTRLAVLRDGKADESDAYYRAIRAVWSPDYVEQSTSPPQAFGPNTANPFRTSLDAKDRHQIVHLSSNFENLKAKGNP